MLPDGSGGFFLSLLTESFAVRALIGSLATVLLAGVALRFDLVRSPRARRIVLVAPLISAVAAAATVTLQGGVYLPQVWVPSSPGGPAAQLLDLVGELRTVSAHAAMDLLVTGYLLVVAVLLARRLVGALAVRRLLARGRPPVGHGELVRAVHRLAAAMQVRLPRLVLLEACPGGALTVGARRPVVALDPALLATLDPHERDGLVAHELAHIRRRDTALGAVVGMLCDLVFFVPPLRLAARWLRSEQEEGADALATSATARPGALASGILKAWDCGARRGQARLSCGALGATGSIALPGLRRRPSARRLRVRRTAQAVTQRIERLLERRGSVSAVRRRIEALIAALVLALAGAAALIVPTWIATELNTYSLSFGYLTAPSIAPVESPAFATFRALAPTDGTERPTGVALRRARASQLQARLGCPCVETPGQLAARVPAVSEAPGPRMLWTRQGGQAWEVRNRPGRGALQGRPLWTLSDSGPQVGVFVVAPSR